jgi:hypothetical protein
MITERTDKFNLKRLENNYILNEESKRLMKQYLIIERDYRYALREMSAKLENLNDYCEMTFYHNPIHHMESRLKSPDTILEKMYRRNYSIDLNTLKSNPQLPQTSVVVPKNDYTASQMTTTQNVVISEDGQMAQEVAEATENLPEVVEEGTEIVPAAATEVLPAAAPGPDAGGKVATEVVK